MLVLIRRQPQRWSFYFSLTSLTASVSCLALGFFCGELLSTASVLCWTFFPLARRLPCVCHPSLLSNPSRDNRARNNRPENTIVVHRLFSWSLAGDSFLLVSWTLLMVRRLFSYLVSMNGQPPCWPSFIAIIGAGLSIDVVTASVSCWSFFCGNLSSTASVFCWTCCRLTQRLPCVRHLFLSSNPITR